MYDNSQNVIEWAPTDMVEVHLNEPDDFLKVKETLSRIGVSSKRDLNVLYQSCHILHKQGRYFIVHFKELFMLDGKPSNFTHDDYCRRNTIITLLSDWGLVRVDNAESIKEITSLKQIKIISHAVKSQWDLRSKYSIGNIKKK
jgi:hypothetical protein